MFVFLKLIVLLLWVVVFCEGIHCPKKCTCNPFGKHTRVTCVGIDQVPMGIPSSAVMLQLSGNSLHFVQEGAFANLTSLKKIDLSSNLLKFIPQNTFRNLKSLSVINLHNNAIEGGFYLPKSVNRINLQNNTLSFDDLKVILRGLKELSFLETDFNRRVGPVLKSDIFDGFERMVSLSLRACRLKYIESGAFRAMKHLKYLDLGNNQLSRLQPGALEGPGDKLITLCLEHNKISTIADGTFEKFNNLVKIVLKGNLLMSVPDLTGPTLFTHLRLGYNHITDLSRLGKSKSRRFASLFLDNNQITYLPKDVFRNISVVGLIDLSFNKIEAIPEDIFLGYKTLSLLNLNFNNISHISRRSFAGLKNLITLMMIKNGLAVIPKDAFAEVPSLRSLFLHSNAVKRIGERAFNGLRDLNSLTLFDNPLTSLPDGIFDEITPKTKASIACNNLREIPPGRYSSIIECAPSATFYIILTQYKVIYRSGFLHSGFVCNNCADWGTVGIGANGKCKCSLCPVGSHIHDFSDLKTKIGSCQACPAGNIRG